MRHLDAPIITVAATKVFSIRHLFSERFLVGRSWIGWRNAAT
jgi:hypothetical protein